MTVTCTNGIICPTPLAWAQTGTHVAIPYGRLLHIFDVTSSTPKRIGSPSPHQAAITTVLGMPKMQFASSSTDCTIKFWDVMDGQCLTTIDVGTAVHNMCAISGALLCVTSRNLIRTSTQSPFQMTKLIHTSFKASSRIAASSDGSIVAIISGNLLYLLSLSSHRSNKKVDASRQTKNGDKQYNHSTAVFDTPSLPYLVVEFEEPLHALAVSDSGNHLAISGNKGLIFHIPKPSRFIKTLDKPRMVKFSDLRPSHLHWHFSPVQALRFSYDDTSLLSGGQESVLVNWKLTSFNVGTKTFLPRIGAPILALAMSPDESHCAMSLGDNSVSIVHLSSYDIVSVIRSIACRIQLDVDHQLKNKADLGRMAVCNSIEPGSIFVANDNTRIQEFNALRGEHVRNINIVPMNETFLSLEGGLSTATVSRVTHVSMHPSGAYLATIDVTRRNADIDRVLNKRVEQISTLRIWERDGKSNWQLCAVAVNPHGDNNSVNSLVFHPTLRVLVSTGTDRKFKFWRATTLEEQGQVAGSWRCELTNSYREKLCRCACFSSDGSLLALGCENVVALWEVCDLLQADEDGANEFVNFQSECSIELVFSRALVHSPISEIVQSVQFVVSSIAFFVVVTSNGIYVWNALTQDICWSIGVKCKPKTLSVDSESGRFAVAVEVSSLAASISGEQRRGIRGDLVMAPGNQIDSVKDARSVEVMNMSDVDLDEAQQNSSRRKGSKKKYAKAKAKRKRPKLEETIHSAHAIAIFDASSPTPIRVHQLAHGVAVYSLSFVQTNSVKKGESNTLNDSPGGSALVCIDSNLELSLIRSDGDLESEFSLTSDEPLSAAGLDDDRHDTMGKLDLILGEGWQNEAFATQSAIVADAIENEETLLADVRLEKVFDDCFAGPIHAQAPVGAQSFEFMKALLNIPQDPATQRRVTENEEHPEQSNAEYAESHGNEEKTVHADQEMLNDQISWDADTEMTPREMRSFCKHIIKSRMKKEKDGKSSKVTPSKKTLSKSEADGEHSTLKDKPDKPEDGVDSTPTSVMKSSSTPATSKASKKSSKGKKSGKTSRTPSNLGKDGESSTPNNESNNVNDNIEDTPVTPSVNPQSVSAPTKHSKSSSKHKRSPRTGPSPAKDHRSPAEDSRSPARHNAQSLSKYRRRSLLKARPKS